MKFEKYAATREGFGEEIVALGQENKNILVVDADIGKSCKTGAFRKALPEQYLNVGIAEQNCAGVAAGLATCGKIPFVVTYAAFGSMRMVEMIRQEICYPNLNVKIACSHGGLTPANDGASHQAIEDMGILRTIPNMTVCMPADAVAARKLVRAAAETYGPVYPILANGDTVCLALEAAEQLAAEGVEARVLDVHTIKPLDVDAVNACIDEIGRLVTVEDHNILNGLGSAVCEVVAERGKGKVKRIGVLDQFGMSAPYERLMAMNGITAENIAAQAKALL